MKTINEQITEAFIACVEKACERWNTVRNYRFTLDIYEFPAKHARTAGFANQGTMTVKINLSHARINLEQTIGNTVPHEVAHLVQKIIRPYAKQAHGPEWRAICLFLGGNGKRCYQMEEFPGLKVRKVKRHQYHVDGEIMLVGPKHHNAIQRGSARIVSRKTKTLITRDMYLSTIIQ